MVAKDIKRKDNRKSSKGTDASRKRTSSARNTLRKTQVKRKDKGQTVEDYNTPFMRKIIIITVLLAVLATGLAVWSFMKIKGLTVYDILSSAL